MGWPLVGGVTPASAVVFVPPRFCGLAADVPSERRAGACTASKQPEDERARRGTSMRDGDDGLRHVRRRRLSAVARPRARPRRGRATRRPSRRCSRATPAGAPATRASSAGRSGTAAASSERRPAPSRRRAPCRRTRARRAASSRRAARARGRASCSPNAIVRPSRWKNGSAQPPRKIVTSSIEPGDDLHVLGEVEHPELHARRTR